MNAFKIPRREYDDLMDLLCRVPEAVKEKERKPAPTTEERLAILDAPKELADAWSRVNWFTNEKRGNIDPDSYNAIRAVQEYVYKILCTCTDHLTWMPVPEDN